MKRGKLIVIEGIDSSGKTTQLNLLKDFFKKNSIQFKTIDFPRYESFYGAMIARFLRGEFGSLDQVNPYIISVIYALDRKDAKEEIEKWLKEGFIVISNRYATSNMAHQAGRFSQNKRSDFVKWDEELEYKVNKIPREDIVIFLDMPVKESKKLMKNKNRVQVYRQGKTKDMVEKDETYLKNSEQTYKWLSQQFSHWVKVECIDVAGKLLSKREIHEEIKKILAKKGMIS
jgi:dTMP kinase